MDMALRFGRRNCGFDSCRGHTLELVKLSAFAGQTDATLPNNSTGILFIGAGHRVDKVLEELKKNKKLRLPLKLVYLINEEEMREWEERWAKKRKKLLINC